MQFITNNNVFNSLILQKKREEEKRIEEEEERKKNNDYLQKNREEMNLKWLKDQEMLKNLNEEKIKEEEKRKQEIIEQNRLKLLEFLDEQELSKQRKLLQTCQIIDLKPPNTKQVSFHVIERTDVNPKHLFNIFNSGKYSEVIDNIGTKPDLGSIFFFFIYK